MRQPGGYVVVSPVRNEERNLPATIQSMVAQTLMPEQWIVVNDGSTDRTVEILEDAARTYPWLSVVHRADRGFREP
jgi:poly-beta-1,6-N-acetyl-D-glucosamine synthase